MDEPVRAEPLGALAWTGGATDEQHPVDKPVASMLLRTAYWLPQSDSTQPL